VTVQKPYQKPCKFCGQSEIYWSDLKRYFTNANGSKHQCPPSSTSHRQLDADKKLNETLNDLRLELASKFEALREDMSSQNAATQKAVASIRAEINRISTLFHNHTGGYTS
jgi:hypothetical protein